MVTTTSIETNAKATRPTLPKLLIAMISSRIEALWATASQPSCGGKVQEECDLSSWEHDSIAVIRKAKGADISNSDTPLRNPTPGMVYVADLAAGEASRVSLDFRYFRPGDRMTPHKPKNHE
jgi:hypothetical protein